jgi:ankyrin repeat protein
MSGLLRAVSEGGLVRVQRLIREGANVKERDEDGWSALLLAARLTSGIDNTHLAMLQ